MRATDSIFSIEMLSTVTVLQAAVMLVIFITVLFCASILVPGHQIGGTDADGKIHNYKFNGFSLFLLTAFLVGIAQLAGWFSLSVLYSHFAALFIAANGFAFALAVILYLQGKRAHRTIGRSLRGFFFGVKANPNWFGVDLKLFSYRPSLIGLALFNASFAVVQYETYGALTLAMILYQVFTFLYVLNYFQFEHGMIHTWDMVSERFGWMLVWGDYVLVPFFYCIAGWWLVHAPDSLSNTVAATLVSLYALGFWMFRGANQQKHRFKRDPATIIWGKPAKSLDGRLLVSGFWGLGRHLNYSGEICIYFAFVLTTQFASWVPFLLPIWLTCLLVHRSRRDEQRCQAKYGELWQRYTKQVRYTMLPLIY